MGEDFDGDTQTGDESQPSLPAAGLEEDTAVRVVGRARKAVSTLAKTGRLRRAGLVDGRYELESLLSRGGMGRVFRARHRDLGRQVALKLVLDELRQDPELRELFFKEARLASSLNHPNIIAVTDFGLDDDLGYFVVMDLLEGETLRERIHRQRPNVRFALDVIDQITGAVRYVHGREVVHCDLKPENIFLAKVEDGERRITVVKLLDFGLSWRRETAPDTKLGGTPPYLAPERLRGQPPSPLCDVYSLGVVLYELVAGRLPYLGSVSEVMQQQLNGPPPPAPSTLSKEPIDPRADELILRAIERDPAGRQASAEAFHFELRALMTMMGISSRRRGKTLLDSSRISGELQLAAVTASPIPIGIFELAGVPRFVNLALLSLLNDGASAACPPFAELRAVQRQPELRGAFERAIGTGQPVRRLVLLGPPGQEPRTYLLLFTPAQQGDAVDSVHLTLVGTGDDG